MFGHHPMFDMPFHPLEMIETLMKSTISAQGKTPITRDFERVVLDYYTTKLLNSDAYSELNSTREFLLKGIREQIERVYPPSAMKKLRESKETKNTVHERDIGNVIILFTGKDGKQNRVHGSFLFGRDFPPVKGLYVMSQADHTVFDGTNHSDMIQVAFDTEKQFTQDVQNLLEHVRRVIGALITVEDVLEALPELKDIEFDFKSYDSEVEKSVASIDRLTLTTPKPKTKKKASKKKVSKKKVSKKKTKR